MDDKRFEEIRNKVIGVERERYGIGTLKEKTLHAILKDYYAPDKDMQEIPIDGYVADIYTGTEIIEIQTAQFNRMRNKLDCFLPNYPVTIVYPVPQIKYLYWIDEETGECSKPRKSTVKGSVYRAFYELYKIKNHLSDPNLKLCFPLLEIEEYRLLNGWSHDRKKGSSRYDRIPRTLLGEIRFERIEDYVQLIPYDLKDPFTAKDFGKAIGEKKEIASNVLHILNHLQVVERCGKAGNSYLYHVVEF
ncbi:MAG: hypothetical protein KIH00_04895 [Lachnospiraceae bacterium]|nr:hypothetical protein [Lachnospiraceae bacterium]MDY5869705.1 hypothetical protein [Lachnospiraceae bacterium]